MGCFTSKELVTADEERVEDRADSSPPRLPPAQLPQLPGSDAPYVETPASADIQVSAVFRSGGLLSAPGWHGTLKPGGLPKPDSAPDLVAAAAAWSVGGKQAPWRVISLTLGSAQRHPRTHGQRAVRQHLTPAGDSDDDMASAPSEESGLSLPNDITNGFKSPPNVQEQQQQQQQLRRSREARHGTRRTAAASIPAHVSDPPPSARVTSWQPMGLRRIASAARRVVLGTRGDNDTDSGGVSGLGVDADGTEVSLHTIRASSVVPLRDTLPDMLIFMSVCNDGHQRGSDSDDGAAASNSNSNLLSVASASGGKRHHHSTWRDRRCQTDLSPPGPAKRSAYDWQRNLLAPAHPRVVPLCKAHETTREVPPAASASTTPSVAPDTHSSLPDRHRRSDVIAPSAAAHVAHDDERPPLLHAMSGPKSGPRNDAVAAAAAAAAIVAPVSAAYFLPHAFTQHDVPLRAVQTSDCSLPRPQHPDSHLPRTSDPSVQRTRSTDTSRLSASSLSTDPRPVLPAWGLGLGASPCDSPISHYRLARSSGAFYERGSCPFHERTSNMSSPRRKGPPSRASSIGSGGGFSCASPSRTSISRSLSNVGGVKCQAPASASGHLGRTASTGMYDVRDSSSRLLRLVEHVMLTDDELYRRVQQSCVGITSLAKETSALQYSRDSSTGATCVNQYVVIKTLGRGSFGKVKLCLNTLDGQLYAVKMVNRAHVQQQLQRPLRALRRKGMRTSSSSLDLHPDYSRAVNRMPSLPDIMEAVDHTQLWSSGARHHRNSVSSPSLPRDMHRLGALLRAHEPAVAAAAAAAASGGGGGGGVGLAGGSGDEDSTAGAGGTDAVGRRHQRGSSCASSATETVAAGGAVVSSSKPSAVRQSLDSAMMGSGQLGSFNMADGGVMREIAVMKKLDHPNVVKLHEVIDPPGAGDLIMILEYCEGGPVMETRGQSGFKRLTETHAWEMTRQLCLGLDYLHYNNVVHGDLKPENLLLSADGQLKVADFGSSSVVSERHPLAHSSCTPAFQAPEQLDKGSSRPVPPFAGDIWALGCILFCFIYGRLPFQGSCVMDISHAIQCQDVVLLEEVDGAGVSPELRHLLSLILCKDPCNRITLQGIMEHAWTTRHGVLPLDSMHQSTLPQQRIEVSRQDCTEAIDHGSLVSLLRARLQEINFRAGEFLYLEGEEAHCIYMIMSGVVELVTDLSHEHDLPDGRGTPCAGSGSSMMLTTGGCGAELSSLDFGCRDLDLDVAADHLSERLAPSAAQQQQQQQQKHDGGYASGRLPPRLYGGGGHTSPSGTDALSGDAAVGHTFVGPEASAIFSDVAAAGGGSVSGSSCGSFSVELDDSLTLDCSTVSAVTVAAEANAEGKLRIDRGKAHDLRKRMKDAALLSSPEYVLEVKGPGQVLGLLAIREGCSTAPVYMHSARAREDVVLVKLTEEAFIEAALHKFAAAAGTTTDSSGALHKFAAACASNTDSSGAHAVHASISSAACHLAATGGNSSSDAAAVMGLPAFLHTMSRECVMIQGLEDLESSLASSQHSGAAVDHHHHRP